MGWSRPNFSFILATNSGSVSNPSPIIMLIGSPAMLWIRKKVNVRVANKAGIVCRTLLKTYFFRLTQQNPMSLLYIV